MRLTSIAAVCAVVLSACASEVFAAPIALVCKSSGSEVHLTIDLAAGSVIWGGQTFHADISATQVHWSGIMPVGRGPDGPDMDATLDRDTGTLLTSQEAGSAPASGIRWGSAHATWACVKPQRIL